MENDKLAINRMKYGLEDLNKLPVELAPYKAAEKFNNQYTAFQGRPTVNFIKVCSN